MAVIVAWAATTEAEVTEFYKTICMTDFVELQIGSVVGFSDGCLPGNLGDAPEALDTGEGEDRLFGMSVRMLQGRSSALDVRVCAGCIQRAACLPMYAHMLKHKFTRGSTLTLQWEGLCNIMPMHKFRDLIDQWLLSSGAAAQNV